MYLTESHLSHLLWQFQPPSNTKSSHRFIPICPHPRTVEVYYEAEAWREREERKWKETDSSWHWNHVCTPLTRTHAHKHTTSRDTRLSSHLHMINFSADHSEPDRRFSCKCQKDFWKIVPKVCIHVWLIAFIYFLCALKCTQEWCHWNKGLDRGITLSLSLLSKLLKIPPKGRFTLRQLMEKFWA